VGVELLTDAEARARIRKRWRGRVKRGKKFAETMPKRWKRLRKAIW